MTELAQQVAERSRQEVVQRARLSLLRMSGPEARGYLRARAADVLLRETDRALAEEPRVREKDREQVISQAADLLAAALMEWAAPQRRAA